MMKPVGVHGGVLAASRTRRLGWLEVSVYGGCLFGVLAEMALSRDRAWLLEFDIVASDAFLVVFLCKTIIPQSISLPKLECSKGR